MKKLKLFFFVVSTLTTMLSGVAVGTPPFGPDDYPFELLIEPAPMPNSAGPVDLKMTLISRSACENATIAVTGLDNLEYYGDTSWTFRTNAGDTNIVSIKVIIPDKDTSGIGIIIKWAGHPDIRRQAFFVADSEKVSFYHGNPRKVRKSPKKRIDMSDPPLTEEQRQGKSSVGYYDEEKNWVPEDSVKNGLSPSGKRVGFFNAEGIFISLDSLRKLGSQSTYDSTTTVIKEGDRSKTWLVNNDGSRVQVDRQWLLDSLNEAKIEEEYEDKRRREEKPCTYSSERIVVNGEAWQRRKGEYEFHKARSSTDTGELQRAFFDSVRAVTPDTAYHISLDLRIKADYDLVAEYIDSLYPMERDGFYHARAKRDVVIVLEKYGIKKAIFPNYPGERPSTPKKKF